jgi:protoporphyrinogen/coproporphyrinogen III oxidase
VHQLSDSRQQVVVIGGGISGLAAAHRLVELDPTREVTLLEAGPRLGGVIETLHRDEYLVERSADNFITNVPWAVDLCRRIGFAEQLIPTSGQRRSALVVCRGRLERVPEGFMLLAPGRAWPILTTPILSPMGKLRLIAERLLPGRKVQGEESLAQFARRRLGRETFERIVQPLVGGIYTADPEKLSLQATLPRFLEMERRWGSLTRAARVGRIAKGAARARENGESGARYGLFVAPRDGLSSLVEAIAQKLPPQTVRLGCRVERLMPRGQGGWTVALADGGGSIDCDAVIVAAPAPAAAQILSGIDAGLAESLARIEYAGSAVVSLAIRREQISHPLDGFGFVVPTIESRRILAASFASIKFAGRAPDGTVLVRAFIGGACQGELLDLEDEALHRIASEELRALLGIRGECTLCDIARWPRSMPQYHLGHLSLVESIEHAAARWPGLALAGNAYRGVGIPHCIHSGEAAADKTHAELARRSPS